MKRRTFLKAGLAGAAVGTVAAPAIVRAQKTFNWKMTTTWPPQLPFYQVGPGSAEGMAFKKVRRFMMSPPASRRSGR